MQNQTLLHNCNSPDLFYRTNIAIDYLINYFYDIPQSITHKLHGLMVLYELSDIEEFRKTKVLADQLLKEMQKNIFTSTDGNVLSINNLSLTLWNALISIVLCKTEKNTKIADSLILTVDNLTVKPEILNSHSSDNAYGLSYILLAFISAFNCSNNEKYLNYAFLVAENILLQKPTLDPYECLGLNYLNNKISDSRYTTRLTDNLKLIGNPVTMTSLVAGLSQQMLIFSNNDKLKQNIIKQQNDCQNYKSGYFNIRPNKKNIRLDFITENILGYIQFCFKNKNLFI